MEQKLTQNISGSVVLARFSHSKRYLVHRFGRKVIIISLKNIISVEPKWNKKLE